MESLRRGVAGVGFSGSGQSVRDEVTGLPGVGRRGFPEPLQEVPDQADWEGPDAAKCLRGAWQRG